MVRISSQYSIVNISIFNVHCTAAYQTRQHSAARCVDTTARRGPPVQRDTPRRGMSVPCVAFKFAAAQFLRCALRASASSPTRGACGGTLGVSATGMPKVPRVKFQRMSPGLCHEESHCRYPIGQWSGVHRGKTHRRREYWARSHGCGGGWCTRIHKAFAVALNMLKLRYGNSRDGLRSSASATLPP